MTKYSPKELQIRNAKPVNHAKTYQRKNLNKDLMVRGSKQISLKIGTPLIQTQFN